MDFVSEMNKPIFVCRPALLYAMCSPDIVRDALANCTAIRGRFVGRILLKAAAARRIPASVLMPLEETKAMEVKELVVSRLECEQKETFDYLDGTPFNGVEAAMEVCKNSKIGQFFFEIEKETVRMAQAAFRRGEFETLVNRRLVAFAPGSRSFVQPPWTC
jgi:hypothetical protein